MLTPWIAGPASGPIPLESALYFVIAEALANVARHSEASWAFVRLWSENGRPRLMVRDDGRGGADRARGSGLRGIQQRLAAFDVAVVDVRLPPTFTDEGLRAAIEARRRRAGFPVLILSQYFLGFSWLLRDVALGRHGCGCATDFRGCCARGW